MTNKILHWYRMIGQERPVDSSQEKNRSIITYVEASSPKRVIREYGGLHRILSYAGEMIVVDYPQHPNHLEILEKNWHPPTLKSMIRQVDPMTLERYIPAIRYLCTCGRMHISEHPYPSVWCTCGQRAYPVEPKSPENFLPSQDSHLTH